MKKNIALTCLIVLLCSISLMGCGDKKNEEYIQAPKGKTILEFGGRASTKIITKDGKVIYIDPYDGDYSEKADLVLVTHEHSDHNNLDLVGLNEGAEVLRVRDTLKDGKYGSYDKGFAKIRAVPAYNSNHKEEYSVGYVIEVDGFKIYHSGDTSTTSEMKDLLKEKIDYALMPYDGEFNMGPVEMAECAKLFNPKFVIPIHGISQKPESIPLNNLKILQSKERIELAK